MSERRGRGARVRLFARGAASCAALAVCALSSAAFAGPPEPWSDPDPPAPPERVEIAGGIGVRGGAEYRANMLYVNPISLNSETDRRISILEHRLRLDMTLDWKDKVRIVASVDALNGTLWGDNGDLGRAPEPSSGANVNTKNVNSAFPCVSFRSGDPLDSKSYGYGLCPADDFLVRRAYGEVLTPFGLFRIGRQPFTEGAAAAVNDGDGRANRFGFARSGNNVDGILFATKPLEILKKKDERDTSIDDGFFLIFRYDKLVQDKLRLVGDDLNQWVSALRILVPEHPLGGDLELRFFHTHRWEERNQTAVNALGLRFMTRLGPVGPGHFVVGLDGTGIVGRTREVSEAFRVINNDPVVSQEIIQFGGRAVLRYDIPDKRAAATQKKPLLDLPLVRARPSPRVPPRFSIYLEADYASGDDDPKGRTALRQFTFAEDTNVGLLLFEHVLAFQTARASAAAVELLRRLNAPTIPVESIATGGAFTNAVAIFPQVDYRPWPDLLVRVGALFAWAPAPAIDPVQSLQRQDGTTVRDDLVNFVGGKPGTFYGTELDARIQYRLHDHFLLDLEGAILFPGDALADVNGDAVRSGMVQGRTTFFF